MVSMVLNTISFGYAVHAAHKDTIFGMYTEITARNDIRYIHLMTKYEDWKDNGNPESTPYMVWFCKNSLDIFGNCLISGMLLSSKSSKKVIEKCMKTF